MAILLVVGHESVLEGRNAKSSRIHLNAGSLSRALSQLASQSGSELLYLPTDVEGRQTLAVDGGMSVEQALADLLKGSGLTFRRSSEGAFIVYVETADLSAAPVPIPEILVIGRRTQNTDIRRTRNDIQPYQVASGEDIASSQSNDPADFIRKQLTSNAQRIAPNQDSNGMGSTRSEINLKGIGTDETLVLVDGGRMPLPPQIARAGFYQPDINAIPLNGIERIETLTSTAGGIYGPGAIGGVVNVVLRRDYRGVDISILNSFAQHGGAGRRRIDARVGFTPDHGRTDVMIEVSHLDGDPLTVGQRTLEKRGDTLGYTNAFDQYSSFQLLANAVNVQGSSETLAFNAEHGGTPLGSAITYLPLGFNGTGIEGAAQLLANAGKVSFTEAPGPSGKAASLLATPDTTSLIASIRHRFNPSLEAYVDILNLQNDGQTVQSGIYNYFNINADSPSNPFDQDVTVGVPAPFALVTRNRMRTTRVTAGLIFQLPAGWKGGASVAIGGVDENIHVSGSTLNAHAADAIATGTPGDGGEPALNPLGNWADFLKALDAYRIPTDWHLRLRSHFSDANFRLAGPIAKLPGGNLDLTLLLEQRRDHALNLVDRRVNLFDEGVTDNALGDFKEEARSAYAELRAPLVSTDDTKGLFRGLELQLTARYDRTRVDAPADGSLSAFGERASVRYGTLSYTAGARFFPLPRLMVRGNVATGSSPPAAELIQGVQDVIPGVPDPKRSGTPAGPDGQLTVRSFGSPKIKATRARTISFGAVFNPSGRSAPRLSIDYTRINKSRELSTPPGLAWAFEHEDDYQGLVVRAPLTDADKLLGYTGGVVSLVDGTYLNIGKTYIETVELSGDYVTSLPNRSTLRVFGSATWEPNFVLRPIPGEASQNIVGYSDGPIPWRANGGAEWTSGPLSIGVNAQYYPPYEISEYRSAYNLDVINQRFHTLQGASHISAQLYADLAVTYRFALRRHAGHPNGIDLRFGVTNLFDHKPPIALNEYSNYSSYGDPRQRQFDLRITARY